MSYDLPSNVFCCLLHCIWLTEDRHFWARDPVASFEDDSMLLLQSLELVPVALQVKLLHGRISDLETLQQILKLEQSLRDVQAFALETNSRHAATADDMVFAALQDCGHLDLNKQMGIPKIRLRDFSSSADLFLHKLEHIVGSCHTVIGLEAHLYNWQRTELMIERERILHCFEHQEEVSSHVQSLKVTIDYALIDHYFYL